MQFKVALVALAASLVSAQIDLSKIPTCALSPAVTALGSSGCVETDIKCICSSTSFLTSLLPAVQAVCSASDLAKAETFAYDLCLTAGITIAIPGTTSSTSVAPVVPTTSVPATSAPASTAPAAPTSTVPAVPVSSVAGVSTVYVTVPCTPSSSSVVVPTTKVSNVTASPTKSATPSAFTGAAAVSYASGATLFGGVMAALAMLL